MESWKRVLAELLKIFKGSRGERSSPPTSQQYPLPPSQVPLPLTPPTLLRHSQHSEGCQYKKTIRKEEEKTKDKRQKDKKRQKKGKNTKTQKDKKNLPGTPYPYPPILLIHSPPSIFASSAISPPSPSILVVLLMMLVPLMMQITTMGSTRRSSHISANSSFFVLPVNMMMKLKDFVMVFSRKTFSKLPSIFASSLLQLLYAREGSANKKSEPNPCFIMIFATLIILATLSCHTLLNSWIIEAPFPSFFLLVVN